MKLYFFENAPADYAAAFRQVKVRHNLKGLRLLASVVLLISGSLLFSSLFISYDTLLANADKYRSINVVLSLFSATALAVAYFLRRNNNYLKHLRLTQWFCLLYSYCFVGCCMLLSFLYSKNPKNSMSMYLLGIISVALVLNFRYINNLVLAVLLELTFIIALQSLDLSAEQLILNHFGSVFILVCYFFVSRLIYSYRLNHFIQVKEIEKKNREIAEASKAKSQILSVVAHDLLSPLATIEMLTNTLRKKKLPPEREDYYYTMILSTCRKSRETISDLLSTARNESVEELNVQETEINTLLEEVQEEWQHRLKGSRKLFFSYAGQPVYAKLNREKFQRVLDNIISNAVKFTPENGRIFISLSREEKEVLLCISDDGIGIPQDLQPYLFERFTKASRTGLRGEKSVGLGLSISQKLVEQLGGKLVVESEEHKGATFRITLPALA